MKHRKILVVIRWPVGGIRTYLNYVYAEELLRNHSFIFLMCESPEVKTLRPILTQNSSEMIVVQSTLELGIKACLLMFKEEIVAIHSHGVTAACAVSTIAKMSKVDHLATLHDVFLDSQFKGLKGLLAKQLIKVCLTQCDRLQPVSKGAEDNLIEFFPGLRRKEVRIEHLLNGIDTERFSKPLTPKDLHSSFNIPENTQLIGFMGRFMPQKGFDILVEAVSLAKRTEKLNQSIAVVCVGSGGYEAKARRHIQALGLEGMFYHLPFTESIERLLVSVDCLIMPSRWEACGLLAMEALSAGTPLIATSCMEEVLEGSPARMVEPENVTELSEAILDFCNNPMLEEFKNYRAIAAQRFDVGRVRLELGNIYRSLERV